jgi:hypothetical protein
VKFGIGYEVVVYVILLTGALGPGGYGNNLLKRGVQSLNPGQNGILSNAGRAGKDKEQRPGGLCEPAFVLIA